MIQATFGLPIFTGVLPATSALIYTGSSLSNAIAWAESVPT